MATNAYVCTRCSLDMTVAVKLMSTAIESAKSFSHPASQQNKSFASDLENTTITRTFKKPNSLASKILNSSQVVSPPIDLSEIENRYDGQIFKSSTNIRDLASQQLATYPTSTPQSRQTPVNTSKGTEGITMQPKNIQHKYRPDQVQVILDNIKNPNFETGLVQLIKFHGDDHNLPTGYFYLEKFMNSDRPSTLKMVKVEEDDDILKSLNLNGNHQRNKGIQMTKGKQMTNPQQSQIRKRTYTNSDLLPDEFMDVHDDEEGNYIPPKKFFQKVESAPLQVTEKKMLQAIKRVSPVVQDEKIQVKDENEKYKLQPTTPKFNMTVRPQKVQTKGLKRVYPKRDKQKPESPLNQDDGNSKIQVFTQEDFEDFKKTFPEGTTFQPV